MFLAEQKNFNRKNVFGESKFLIKKNYLRKENFAKNKIFTKKIILPKLFSEKKCQK